ncbi:helix-turn-helix domain-containing protein [Microbacterium sp. NPDC057650]|uniref:helix-turn-helix domain-containing protein n=1 Tax=Microbacterium sp. NPDC057650 TaxID=3346193 RepID=UPI00366E3568
MRANGATETIVLLCVGGRGVVEIGGATHQLTRSSAIAIPAGQAHSYESSSEDPWTIWWLHIRGSDAVELANGAMTSDSPITRLRSLDRVAALFDELVTTLEKRLSPAQLLLASGIAWNLLARIASDNTLPVEGSALERAMRYLEARVDGSIQVGELAALVGISQSHLSALFREATGGGPAAFHSSLRMTRARALLDTTALSIREVALAVGYTDPLYFSRHFRRHHEMSPSEYRSLRKG